MLAHPFFGVGSEISIDAGQRTDRVGRQFEGLAVFGKRYPTIGTRISNRRTGRDFHETVLRQTAHVAVGSDTADVEVAGQNEVYAIMHQQVTHLIRLVITAGRFEGTDSVKMLQYLPVRHGDNLVAFGNCRFGLRCNPFLRSCRQLADRGFAVRSVNTNNRQAG